MMKVFPLTLSIAAITFVFRALPLVLLTRRPLSQRMLTYLRALPVGVLAAVAAVSVWPRGGNVDAPFAVGTALAAVLALRTGNLLVTLLGAMAVAAVLRIL